MKDMRWIGSVRRRSVWKLTLLALISVTLVACGGSGDSGGDGDGHADGGLSDGHSGTGDTVTPPRDQVQPDGAAGEDGVADATPDGGTADAVDPDATLPDVQPDVQADVPADAPNPGDVPPEVSEELYGVGFDGVADAETVRGSIRIWLKPAEIDEWSGMNVTLTIDGTPVFSDSKLPTDFVLDTATYPDGPHTLVSTATAGSASESTSVTLTFDNADFAFMSVNLDQGNYNNGDTVTITVDLGEGQTGLTVAADFSAIDSTFAAGNIVVTDNGDGTYAIAYPIGAGNTIADGDYRVTVTATGAEGIDLTYRNLLVPLRNRQPTPIHVEGGIYVDEDLPPSSTDGSKKPFFPNPITGNQYIITGGSAQILANVADPDCMPDVIGILVGVSGYSGYYHVPRPQGGGVVPMKLLLDPNAGIAGGQTLTLLVGAVDRTGHVSDFQTFSLTTISVMSGDVQVSVSWDTFVDVDLHVIEPSGEELFYGHRGSATGGQLDLDSNPACSLDRVNNENVSWPIGQSPPGQYTVLVDYWSACGGQSANYTVTVKNCGEVNTFQGTFHGSDASSGGACGATQSNWASNGCAAVATFDNTCGFLAEGFLRYEDRTFNEEGFRGRAWKPVRYAIVEARRNADGAVLGTSTTDRFGYYRVRFRNDGAPGFYVVLKTKTSTEDGLRDVTVYNHPKFGKIYEFVSQLAFEQIGVPVRIDLDVPVLGPNNEAQAGALNIFDVALAGYDRIRRMTGKELGPLGLYWQTGADTTATLYCTQELYNQTLCGPLDSLQIQGKDRDRDEYDDCVILRQLYKFAESKISATDNPADGHDFTRDDPRQSWSEGFATFFAAHTRRDPVFVDTNFGGVYRVQWLDDEASTWSYGTSSGAQQGYLSELVVSSVLWDLADGIADDEVTANPNGVYDAAFNYLGGPAYVGNRGFPGRDFVDFLDGWFCRGHGQIEAVRSVLEERDFPYDFAGPEMCSACTASGN